MRPYRYLLLIVFFLSHSATSAMHVAQKKECWICQQPVDKKDCVVPCTHCFHDYCIKNTISMQKLQNKVEIRCCYRTPNCVLSGEILRSLERRSVRAPSPELIEKCSACLGEIKDEENDYNRQAVTLCAAEFDGKEADATLKKNGHPAHRGCAIIIAVGNGVCPLCRGSIIYTNLISPLTEQQYKQFYKAEFCHAAHLGVFVATVAMLGKSILNSPQDFNKAYLMFSMAVLTGRPLHKALYAQLTLDFDCRVVRRFPHVFWKKWGIRFLGCSLGCASCFFLTKLIIPG